MLLILWIFLFVRQIHQWFLSILFNWLSCLCRKFWVLSWRLVWKDREMGSFCVWHSVFRSKCYLHLATINSENISEGSPTERFYVTSLSWDSQGRGILGMFPLYILDFGGNQETQPSITVLPFGYYKALRFWDYCFLESTYETLYRLFNKGRNCFCLWQNHHFSFLSGIWNIWWRLVLWFGALVKDNSSQKVLLSHSSFSLWKYLSPQTSQL